MGAGRRSGSDKQKSLVQEQPRMSEVDPAAGRDPFSFY